jgi:universal stress protein E
LSLFGSVILAASDLTGESDDVVRAAGALAAVADARFHIVHSVDVESFPYMPDEVVRLGVEGRLPGAREELARQIARVVPPSGPTPDTTVAVGNAARKIEEVAADAGADLIVLGPHRKRSRIDALLGSTADRVLRTAKVPCLIAHRTLSLPLKRVVVAADLSSAARVALREGHAWAESFGRPSDGGRPTEMTVLHVVPEMFRMGDYEFDEQVVRPELRKEVRAALKDRESDRVEVREVLLWGEEIAESIDEFALARGCDLLVVGTHGHGALRRMLIGGVASRLARSASCPVLLVPPTRLT